jgi:hypothetical protein
VSTVPHICSTSTTFDVVTVTIRAPRRAQVAQPPQATSPAFRGWRGLKRLDWRKPHGLTMRYRHGQDPYVVVNARGREWAFVWDTAILDVLRDICGR